jgi:hypothetical protein
VEVLEAEAVNVDDGRDEPVDGENTASHSSKLKTSGSWDWEAMVGSELKTIPK